MNPLHPGAILISNKDAKELLYTVYAVLPPGASVVAQITPPAGMVWVEAIQSMDVVRDYITGNPLNTPLVYVLAEHSMITSFTGFAVGSALKQWPIEIDISVNDPFIVNAVNNLGIYVSVNFSFAALEVPQRFYDDVYLKYWKGLKNLVAFLGEFDLIDMPVLAKAVHDTIIKGQQDVLLEKKTE